MFGQMVCVLGCRGQGKEAMQSVCHGFDELDINAS